MTIVAAALNIALADNVCAPVGRFTYAYRALPAKCPAKWQTRDFRRRRLFQGCWGDDVSPPILLVGSTARLARVHARALLADSQTSAVAKVRCGTLVYS